MQYLGGKSRIAKQLAQVIDSIRRPGQPVWDAFCGGLSMSVALSKNGPVRSTDACAALIALYRAVQSGWEPPNEVSSEEYAAAKSLPDSDPMKAFCGFGCSFGGKWFGGWGGPSKHHPTGLAIYTRNSLLKNGVPGVVECVDFMSVQPRPCKEILYLDPPYYGTTRYAGVPSFDSERFVERVGEWARHTHVFVSEYSFPIGECVFEKASKTKVNGGMSGKALDAVERLHYIGPCSWSEAHAATRNS